MKLASKYLLLFVASGAVCLSTSIATVAGAWETRTSPFACMTFGGVPVHRGGGIGNDGMTPMEVLCDVRDETGATKQSTTQLHIHGYDDTTVDSVFATACRTSAFFRGGACTPSVATGLGGLGDYQLNLPVAGFWATVTDFGYVVISIPPKQGNAFISGVRGIYQAD